MADRIYKVLFICSGNLARSILAQALMNPFGRDRFKAYSAGSHPRGEVQPMTLEVLTSSRYDVGGLRSKSWTEFARPDAPPMDFIITVCDLAAKEACPTWPGQPITAQWDIADPAAVAGDRETQLKALKMAQSQIATRIRLFLSLPVAKIDKRSLQTKLRELGQQR